MNFASHTLLALRALRRNKGEEEGRGFGEQREDQNPCARRRAAYWICWRCVEQMIARLPPWKNLAGNGSIRPFLRFLPVSSASRPTEGCRTKKVYGLQSVPRERSREGDRESEREGTIVSNHPLRQPRPRPFCSTHTHVYTRGRRRRRWRCGASDFCWNFSLSLFDRESSRLLAFSGQVGYRVVGSACGGKSDPWNSGIRRSAARRILFLSFGGSENAKGGEIDSRGSLLGLLFGETCWRTLGELRDTVEDRHMPRYYKFAKFRPGSKKETNMSRV